MSINSSSFPNSTISPSPMLNPSSSFFYIACSKVIPSFVLYSIYNFINILLLTPLYIYVIYTGYQLRRKQNTASKHSDVFTYHIVAVEIFGVLGAFLFYLAVHTHNLLLAELGILVPSVIFPGQTLFHCLACFERYLAVLHPVIYRRLQEKGGVRVRDVSIGCVWLLCFGWIGQKKLYLPHISVTPLVCLFVPAIIFISFCSFSVLFTLTHPGPKDMGGDKERVAQSKQRAFFIMISITCVLVLRFMGVLGTFGLYYLVKSIQFEVVCTLMDFGILLTIPSSLILPLLFLHKTGKLAPFRRRNL